MKKIITILVTIVLILSFASTANAQIEKDQYYARSMLDGDELEYYDAAYDKILGMDIKLYHKEHGLSAERAQEIIDYIYGDAPELINEEKIYTEEEIAELYEQIEKKAKRILLYVPTGATEYETVEYLYNWTVENVMYYYGYTPQEVAESQTIVGGLIREEAVCAGIARTLQYLLYQKDIQCYTILGTFKGGLHAWNLIQIDGEWYYADPTEDYFHKDGFLMTTADLEKYNLWIDPELNPPLPETPTEIPMEYMEPVPTPTPTPQPTQIAAPIAAAPNEEVVQETIPEEAKTNPALWVIAAGAAAVILLLIIRKKKNA